MGRDRSAKRTRKRNEGTREVRKSVSIRGLINFSFKDLDQSQPKDDCQTVGLWHEKGLLRKLFVRIAELSKVSKAEAIQQQQIKIYGDFPPNNKTDFEVPRHVDPNVEWGVIENIGGKPRVAGYMVENTFYVVFLDGEHKFWKSEKRNT